MMAVFLLGGCVANPQVVKQALPAPKIPLLGSVLEPPLPPTTTRPLPRYKLELLNFRAQAINDSGLVCGALTVSKRDAHSHKPYYEGGHLAVLERGVVRDLGKVPGTDWCIANAVNNRGEITGVMGEATLHDGAGEPGTVHFFLWSRGRFHDFGVNGTPTAINDVGQIVGQREWTHGRYGYQHGFLYSSGLMREVQEASEIDAVNNRGQMVGNASGLACFWYKGKAMGIPLPERRALDGQSGPKINDVGQIVINAYTTNPLGTHDHCYLWHNGKITDIGLLPGFTDMNGIAINRRGDVVGNALVTGSGYKSHPFLWRHGSLCDLNDLAPHRGWTMTEAAGINNRGQIIGQEDGSGKEYNFLLTPVTK